MIMNLKNSQQTPLWCSSGSPRNSNDRRSTGPQILRGSANSLISIAPSETMRNSSATGNANGLKGMVTKAIRGLGGLTNTNIAGSRSSLGLQTTNQDSSSNGNGNGALTSEMKSNMLREAAACRKSFHEDVLGMDTGSEEWRQMQLSLRQSKAITHAGLVMAINCHFVDNSPLGHTRQVSKPADSEVNCAAKSRSEPKNHRRFSAPPEIDSRRHLIRRESLTEIKKKVSEKIEMQAQAAGGGGILDFIAKARATPSRTGGAIRRASCDPAVDGCDESIEMESRKGVTLKNRRRGLSRRGSCPSLSALSASKGETSVGPKNPPVEQTKPEWRVVERTAALRSNFMSRRISSAFRDCSAKNFSDTKAENGWAREQRHC
jgi:hypothetical protein